MIIVVFVVDGCRLNFFDGGEPVDRHSALCLLVWGSYWKHHDSSSALILLTNVASFCALCNKSAQIEARTSFWSWVSACRTSLAWSFCLPKSSRRIWWQVDLLICRASANSTVFPYHVSDANHVVLVPWTWRSSCSCGKGHGVFCHVLPPSEGRVN